jgi:capsular exopolysaccharide synthesis family protein
VGLAFLRDFLDDSITAKEDLAILVPHLPALGLIPEVGRAERRHIGGVFTLSRPDGSVAEAYRSVRTSLQFLDGQRVPRVFQVTSARAGEGKTSVVANLGVVLARAGQRVVLVDCDLRRANLHHVFGLPNDIGLTTVLANEASVDRVLQRVPDVEGLAVLTSGALPSDPAEVMSSRRVAEVLGYLQRQFDVVIVDSPPVIPVTDPIVLSGWVDAVLLVAASSSTGRRDVLGALEILEQVDAPLAGTILNRVKAETAYGYEYYRRPRRERSGRARRSPIATVSKDEPGDRASA